MVLYLEITKDKYQLPLAVADSITELARLRGVSKSCISNTLTKSRLGITKKTRYIQIEVDDD